MGMLSVLKIAGSALTAQRLRMDVTSSNVANAEATNTPQGGPYRKARVVFEPTQAPATFQGMLRTGDPTTMRQATPGTGVRVRAVVQDQSPPRRVLDPTHPDAGPDGYVSYPNVDLVSEMTDMLSASRAYEANITAINVAKNMAQHALDLGRA